jgi:hypothetical protein
VPQFQPGCDPGPGRPKGSFGGRHRVLQLLDDLFAREENLTALERALQTEFDADPPRFWRTYGFPLVPKEAVLELLPKPLDENQRMYLEAIAMVARDDAERAERRKLAGKGEN